MSLAVTPLTTIFPALDPNALLPAVPSPQDLPSRQVLDGNRNHKRVLEEIQNGTHRDPMQAVSQLPETIRKSLELEAKLHFNENLREDLLTRDLSDGEKLIDHAIKWLDQKIGMMEYCYEKAQLQQLYRYLNSPKEFKAYFDQLAPELQNKILGGVDASPEALKSRLEMLITTASTAEVGLRQIHNQFFPQRFEQFLLNQSLSDYAIYRYFHHLPEAIRLHIPEAMRPPFMGRGNAELYKHFGAHADAHGVTFRLYAPNALEVKLVTDCEHDMVKQRDGTWELRLDGAKPGLVYNYSVNGQEKIDPFGFQAEVRPGHRNIVVANQNFPWTDNDFRAAHTQKRNHEKPLNIYEVHLGSWMRKQYDQEYMNYREIAPILVDHLNHMNFTAVELMGIIEHPNDDSMGYQISNFFAPTSRMGSIEDFKYLINYLHEQGFRVILDISTLMFLADDWCLREFDGSPLFEDPDPKNGSLPDWGTQVFDFRNRFVTDFLLSFVNFWTEEMHIDGYRFDAIQYSFDHSQGKADGMWAPNEFGRHENHAGQLFARTSTLFLRNQFPNLLIIAEDSSYYPSVFPHREGAVHQSQEGGFNFLDGQWNMHLMNETLTMIELPPEERSKMHKVISDVFDASLNYPNISEISHDEVAHLKPSLLGRMQNNPSPFASLRVFEVLSKTFPSEGVLTFMGSEFAVQDKWRHNEKDPNGMPSVLNWTDSDKEPNQKHMKFFSDLQAITKENSNFWTAGLQGSNFQWVNRQDWQNVIFAYRRINTEKRHVVVLNFSNNAFPQYDLWFSENWQSAQNVSQVREVFNSNQLLYGGDGSCLSDRVEVLAHDGSKTGYRLSIPAQSGVIFEEIA